MTSANRNILELIEYGALLSMASDFYLGNKIIKNYSDFLKMASEFSNTDYRSKMLEIENPQNKIRCFDMQ